MIGDFVGLEKASGAPAIDWSRLTPIVKSVMVSNGVTIFTADPAKTYLVTSHNESDATASFALSIVNKGQISYSYSPSPSGAYRGGIKMSGNAVVHNAPVGGYYFVFEI